MSIIYSCKTNAPATLKLFNHIASYMFEQEYEELQGETEAKDALFKVRKELSKIIKKK